MDAAAAKRMVRAINRNELKKTTTYEAAIPWSALRVIPGASDHVGLALCFKDAVLSEDEDLDWGNIRSSKRPREFHRFTVPAPKGRIAEVTISQTRIAGSGDQIFATLAYRDSEPAEARISVGGTVKSVALSGGAEIQRLRLRMPASLLNPEDGRIQWVIDRDGSDINSGAQRVLTPTILHHTVQQKLAALAAAEEDPLAVEHLRNTALILE